MATVTISNSLIWIVRSANNLPEIESRYQPNKFPLINREQKREESDLETRHPVTRPAGPLRGQDPRQDSPTRQST